MSRAIREDQRFTVYSFLRATAFKSSDIFILFPLFLLGKPIKGRNSLFRIRKYRQ